MAVPKKKHTKSRRDKRRTHIFLKAPMLIKCPRCQKPTLPHRVCLNCGYYKERQVINVVEKVEKKEKKTKSRT